MTEDRISEHLQDSLVYLAITDDVFSKAVVGQVPPEFFQSDVTQQVYRIALEYIRQFSRPPGDHFQDELVRFIADKDIEEKELYVRYIDHLQKMRSPNRDYVLDRLNTFIRSRELIRTTYDFAEMLERGQIDAACQKMYQALKSGIHTQNVGLDFLNDTSDLKLRGDSPERLFKLRIKPIDKGVRIKRCDLIVIAAPYKGGKSWFGQYMARCALSAGLNVVHVSHEMSLEETANRYDMMFGGMTDRETESEVEVRFLRDKKIVTETRIRPSIYSSPDLVRKTRAKVRKFGGRLICQKYPQGTCSPVKLDGFLDYVENFMGISADVVINDYADVMAPIDKTKQTRDALNETYMYLKRIADDRHLAMVTMSQVNDEGLRTLIHRGRLEGRHLAEDKRKFATIDKGLFVGTTPKLEVNHEAVVGVFANRSGNQGQRCIIGQNYELGQFYVYDFPFNIDLIR